MACHVETVPKTYYPSQEVLAVKPAGQPNPGTLFISSRVTFCLLFFGPLLVVFDLEIFLSCDSSPRTTENYIWHGQSALALQWLVPRNYR